MLNSTCREYMEMNREPLWATANTGSWAARVQESSNAPKHAEQWTIYTYIITTHTHTVVCVRELTERRDSTRVDVISTLWKMSIETVSNISVPLCIKNGNLLGLSKWLKNYIRIVYLNMIKFQIKFEYRRHNFSKRKKNFWLLSWGHKILQIHVFSKH